MRLPTLRQLQYFVAVADTLSISQAAELCHVTQPSLSVGLSELEDLLGTPLFERRTRNVQLTPTGTTLLRDAKAILRQSENLVHLAHAQRAPLSAPLTLGVIPTIAPYILPRLLPLLQTEFPQLDLRLKEDLTGRQLDDLKRGVVDVVLMAFPYDAPQTESLILWTEPFFLAKASGRDRSSADSVTLDDLQHETILLLDDGHCLRDHIITACHLTNPVTKTTQHTQHPQRTLGATSLPTLIQMVQHGYGATLLPAMAITPSDPPKGLTIQRFANPQPTRKIGLAWRSGDPRRADFHLLGALITRAGGRS